MARGRWLLSVVLCASTVLVPLGSPQEEATVERWIVGLDGVPTDLGARLSAVGADLVRVETRLPFAVVDAPASLVPALGRLPSVRYVEPDLVVDALDVPTDPLWGEQWGPKRIHVPEARELVKGSPDVLVAVLDTGVDWRLPDLEAHIWNENGRHGYNLQTAGAVGHCLTLLAAVPCLQLVTAPGEDRLLTPMDYNGHGTHVAGTIAAISDNAEGVAGVAQVQILPVKVLASGSSVFNHIDIAASGILVATDAGADVVSMSFGCYCPAQCTQTFRLAMDYAWDHGVLLVASAGNDDATMPLFPASYEKVISVMATDPSDAKAEFSNFGPTVDLGAPGVDVLSTRSRWYTFFGFVNGGVAYWTLSGTSMAAPHVSGVAALAKSANPDLSNAEIRAILESTAEDLGAAGRDDTYGFGLVDAHAAVAAALAA